MPGRYPRPRWGEKGTGPNPTDRGTSGTKRSLVPEGYGIPIGLAVEGANRYDMQLTGPTLEAMVGARPAPTEEAPQHLCLDKGDDYPQVRELVAAWGYTAHIRTRGEEAQEKREVPGYRARRWVGERTHAWLNRF